ncbi:MAG: prepilin-type N-terminal cleavage/methylation domain-containing protein [Planctomycetota bacterium]|nr:prepilin-type N-terminal cleavage/methylation domain-containing protein [Planctomycetota bacterium]
MRPSPSRFARARTLASRGFTLIELLVVISIIALLIGILLPALGAARANAQAAECLAHVRGLTQLTHLYATDNNSYFPLRPNGAVGGGGVWGAFWSSRKLIEYEGGTRNLNLFADPADKDASHIHPLGGDTAYNSSGAGSPITWGADHSATSAGGFSANVLGVGNLYGTGDNDDSISARISYGINTNLTLQANNTGATVPNTRFDLVNANKLDQYQFASQTLVYADNGWVNSRGFAYDVNATVGSADPTDNATGTYGFFLRYRTAFANLPGTRTVWTANAFGNGVASQTAVDGQSYQKIRGVSSAVLTNGSAWSSYSFGPSANTRSTAVFDYAQGKFTAGVPVFDAQAKLYARHPGGVNNIAFIDGSARGVSQADSVDVTPVSDTIAAYGTARGFSSANSLNVGSATNTSPLAKIIYSVIEKPK